MRSAVPALSQIKSYSLDIPSRISYLSNLRMVSGTGSVERRELSSKRPLRMLRAACDAPNMILQPDVQCIDDRAASRLANLLSVLGGVTADLGLREVQTA